MCAIVDMFSGAEGSLPHSECGNHVAASNSSLIHIPGLLFGNLRISEYNGLSLRHIETMNRFTPMTPEVSTTLKV